MIPWGVVAITTGLTVAFAWAAARSSGQRRQRWAAGAGAWLGVTGLVLLRAFGINSMILTGLAIFTVVVCATVGVYFRLHPPAP